MPRSARKNKKRFFSWQLLTVVLLLIILPLVVLQLQERQIIQQDAAGGDKPNVIVVMTDDQWYEDSLSEMPTVRGKLAKDGVTFTNFYVTTSLCCPSRASFLTGQYAHNHGVLSNRPPDGGAKKFKPKDNETLAVWLKQAGYKTALIGKYLNEYDSENGYLPPGWDKWYVFDDKNGKYYNYTIIDEKKDKKKFQEDDKDYSNTVFTKEAKQFINKTDGPFFLFFTPHAPHGPAERNVEEKYQGKCNNTNVPNPPSMNENDVSDKPQWIRSRSKLSQAELNKEKDERRQKLCLLKSVDDSVNEFLKALGNKKNNTIFIFTSDNGYAFGEHRWIQKDCLYEECVKVPLIISYPKAVKKNVKNNAIVGNIDLAPTIMDLIGLPIPDSVDGVSLKPLLTGGAESVREMILLEVFGNNPPTGSAVRNQKYKYIKLETGEEEIYDMTKDPHELNNQIKNSNYNQVKEVLAAQLQALVTNQVPEAFPPVLNPPNPADYYNDWEEINRPSDSSDYDEAIDPATEKCLEEGEDAVATEVGCVPKNPHGFALKFYRIGLGLVGGLSLLFIIIGGYLLLTSSGNPARVGNGKKFIFYAVFGLLLTIFGYVFIEVIAIDVLKLPGFER